MSANGLEAPQYADGDTYARGQMMQLMCGCVKSSQWAVPGNVLIEQQGCLQAMLLLC